MNLQYTGFGTRVLNFAIDTVLAALLAILFYRIYNWYVFYYQISYLNFGWFFFGTLFLYYSIFESLFARTPGKWFSHSKVVKTNGSKPGFLQIIVRSLIRITIIDMFCYPFLEKTLHDYVSKTELVQA